MKGKSTFQKQRRYVQIIAAILGILMLVLSLFAFTKPVYISNDHLVNTIHIKTAYQLEEKVKPNILYPKGTTLFPEKTLTAAFADDFLIHINTTVTSDEPVEIKGNYQPLLTIKGGDLWTKTIPLNDIKNVTQTCQSCAFDMTMTIKAKNQFSYLDKVESQLNLHPNDYEFHIQPQLKGSVYYKGITYPLDDGNGLVFSRHQNELTLGDNEKLAITKSYPIKKVVSTTNVIHLPFYALPVKTARIIFALLTLIFFIIWFVARDRKKKRSSEFQTIDQKYQKLLVPVKKQMKLDECTELELESFPSLVFISDEKESPIFRYENTNEILYFVPDYPLVYFYALPKE